MTAAQAFLNYRTFAISRLSPEKRAGWQDALGAAGDYISKNPWAQGALAGGALGGLTGIPSGNIVRNALYGAGIGGTIGGGKQLLDYLGNMPQPQQEQPVEQPPSFYPTSAKPPEQELNVNQAPDNQRMIDPSTDPERDRAYDELPSNALELARAQAQRTNLGQQNLGQQRFV